MMHSPRRWTGTAAPFWSFPPPRPVLPKYERLKVDTGAKALQVVIVSSRIEEIGTHYIDSRTVPCTGCQGECWLDHREVGQARYSGWLIVRAHAKMRPQLLALTKVAVEVEPRLRDAALDLRGLTVKVWRLGVHERSEMHAALDTTSPRVQDLPPCPEVRFLVERLMRADDRPEWNRQRLPGGMARAAAAQAKGGAS